MLDCCIVFLHHRDDPTTRAHLDLLRRLNPYPVVAVCNGAAEHVAGALDVARSSERWRDEDRWAGVDTVLYRWFLQGGLRARRYLFLEWDTMATMPVRDFYAEVWDADAAASVVKRIERDPDWIWFLQRDRLPEPLRPHAAGLVPLNGTLLSHRALAAVARGEIPDGVFSELRLATLVRAHGFDLAELPEPKRRMNLYDRRLITFDPDRPGLYHPIKEAVRREPPVVPAPAVVPAPPPPQPRPPGRPRRILYVNRNCYLDHYNGAAIACRGMMAGLARSGFAVEALTGAMVEVPVGVEPGDWLAERGLVARGMGAVVADARGVVADDSAARREVDGVPVTVLLGHPARLGQPSDAEYRDTLDWLDRTLDRFRPDVLVSYGGDRLSREIRLRARRRGVAVVFALHNFAYSCRSAFEAVDAVVVPSRFAAEHYRRTLELDCAVLPNAVDLDRFHVPPAEVDPRYVTFVNPTLEKGVFAFARIADELGRTRPDIPLLVVEGRGSERTLAECGLDLARRGNVALMGHTPDPRQFWGVTRICLLPSLWWENQPLVAVEAMSNGIPVVGSDRGGIPEALGRSGVVLPLPARLTAQTREMPTAAEVAPWVEAVARLWDDGDSYRAQSRLAAAEAARWAAPVVAPLHADFFTRVGATILTGGREV